MNRVKKKLIFSTVCPGCNQPQFHVFFLDRIPKKDINLVHCTECDYEFSLENQPSIEVNQ